MLDTMTWGGRIDVLDLMLVWVLTEFENAEPSKLRQSGESPYFGYIKSLPLSSSCPLAVPEELWSLLPNQTRVDLDKEYEDVLTRYERMQKVVKSSYVSTVNNLNFATFKWAYWVIRSRWVACYDYDLRNINRRWLSIGTDNDNGALCPWFDMCNHSLASANVSYMYTIDVGMVMKCTSNIRAGEEILISYTGRPDDEMFLDYGFAPGDNEESHISFTLEVW